MENKCSAEPTLCNLEQIRAKIAIDAAEKIGTGSDGGRAVAKKVPALIIQNGFLAALAFAIESINDPKFQFDVESGYYRNMNPRKNKEGKNDPFEGCGYANTFLSVMKDLKETKKDGGFCNGNLVEFLGGLCGNADNPAQTLRMVTDEALHYLNYLRRFAKSDEKTGEVVDVQD